MTVGSDDRAVTHGTPSRRGAIDVARLLALGVVVLGHLTLAVIDRSDGELRGANLLALEPSWSWMAAAAPMPVFFAAGGWANAASDARRARPRLARLAAVGSVVVGLWSAATVITILLADDGGSDGGIVADGARIATQPLWFLAAYAPFSASGRHLAELVARRPRLVFGSCLAAMALLDLLRFGLDLPDLIGWPGFFVAWAVPWFAGAWWRDRSADPAFDERRTGLILAVGAAVAAVLLVHTAGYSPALIDAVPGQRSNTTPPTLYTAVGGLAQVGVLLLVAPILDRIADRLPRLVASSGDLAIGIYLWHLSALALVSGVVALGVPVPERLTATWWWTRPLWWAAVLTVATALVGVTAWRSPGRSVTAEPRPGRDRLRATLGIVGLTATAAFVGIEGPRSIAGAIICTSGTIGSWALLRTNRRRT